MLTAYRDHEAQRGALGIPPLPVNPAQVVDLIAQLRSANQAGADVDALLELLTHRVPAGVDEAARPKADFLAAIAGGREAIAAISPRHAVELLGTMLGGYNVTVLVGLLDDPELGDVAARELASTLLVFDAFHDVAERARHGNPSAQAVLQSWAEAKWFTCRAPLPDELHLTVFKVDGEITTDDLSPAPEAWSRPDVPLHARSLLEKRVGPGVAIQRIADLKAAGRPIAFVGEVVGTGSSRKSAVNSLQWHVGTDIPFVPNKRQGGVVIAAEMAPIFFNTLRDAGAFPIECEVDGMATGDHIVLRPHEGRIDHADGKRLAEFRLGSDRLLDEVRAGGRVPLIVGRTLTSKARDALGLEPSPVFRGPRRPPALAGYTLAQKIVGQACGVAGVAPGTYCEPTVSTVGSQDTTGPMNRNELLDLACLGFSADLVLQTFCHTAAYPRPVDIETQRTLPEFMGSRGAIVLRPGDGIIHTWLNRMLLPDQVGTGSDSHTRFPLGISFPAGSGLVAFAAAMGVMPVDMPESVRVRFHGATRPGITMRDLVHAIPYAARQQGLLTLDPSAKRNVFSGRIVEIEGLEQLSAEQAFELTDSTAERSAAGCTITLSERSVTSYLESNLVLLHWLIDSGYQDARSLARRAQAIERWLANPTLLRADQHATYAATVEVDAGAIDEPLLACPNDPDNIRPLSEVAGRPIDEVFIGSCMTNIGHFRAAGQVLARLGRRVPTTLWIAPPTRMDEAQLRQEGYYRTFAEAGARTEIPGCSLCMGNQARVAPNATVVSTSTRNFPNRMGEKADVFLASAEVASVAAVEGRLPSVAEYFDQVGAIDTAAADIYRFLDFTHVQLAATHGR